MVKIFTQNCPKPLSTLSVNPEPSKCMSIIKGHLVPTRGIADKKDIINIDKPSVLEDTLKPVNPERANEEKHFSKMKPKGTLKEELKKQKHEEPGVSKEDT